MSTEVSRYKCYFCFEPFFSKEECNLHLRLHSEHFRCLVCDAEFESGDLLRGHMSSHSSLQSCTLCDYATNRPDLFDIHQRKHLVQRPFKCNSCPSTYRDTFQLQRHVLTHTKEKKFHCALCDYMCHRHSSLLRHTRAHVNYKPHQCSVPGCTMAFVEKSKMRLHLQTHRNAKPFECHVCGHKFKHNDSLRLHKRTAHSERRKNCATLPKCNLKPPSIHFQVENGAAVQQSSILRNRLAGSDLVVGM